MVTSIMTKNVCFSLEDSKEPECDYMKMANVASNCSRLLVETISKWIMSSLTEMQGTWFIHFLRGHIVKVFIEASTKSFFRFANIVCCLRFLMNRYLNVKKTFFESSRFIFRAIKCLKIYLFWKNIMIKTTLIYATETLTNTEIAQWAMADGFLLKWVNLLYDHHEPIYFPS